jgi:ABC-type nitrate/sulfonate/bicarbonate transport system substrate-binding protein
MPPAGKKLSSAQVGLVILGIVLLSLIAVTFFPSSPSQPVPEESLTIGTAPVEGASLIYIAQDQGFFAKNGLNITIRDYDTGSTAFKGMENREVDISVASEYSVVGAALKKENISIIGIIDKFQTQHLVARKDRGIEKISDLKGKRIGVSRQTIREFYLGRFLTLQGMSLQDVTLVNVPTSESVTAITNGSVDAIIFYQPYVNFINNQLGDNGVTWPAQSSQLTYNTITCRNEWIASHPGQINRFLTSLQQAEEYILSHPAESKAIVQKRLNFTADDVTNVWPDHQFSLSLDQALIVALEDESRWMMQNNLTPTKVMPNYLEYIYTSGLRTVKPASMRIIR